MGRHRALARDLEAERLGGAELRRIAAVQGRFPRAFAWTEVESIRPSSPLHLGRPLPSEPDGGQRAPMT